MKRTKKQLALHVSFITIIWNVLLSALKLAAGFIANSAAIISDSIHSLSDVLSTFIVIIGVKMAGKSADREHPYGHERFECVAAIILAVILFLTGFTVGAGGIKTIISGSYHSAEMPGILALAAAVLSIIVKELMYHYTKAAAKKTDSPALLADAWHHRSDALSSVASFIGILGARIGYPVLDSAACVVICLFIIKVSYNIFRDSINKMTDHSCDEKTVSEISSLILSQTDVDGIDVLKTRLFGDKIYLDVEINVKSDITLLDSHAIAHLVHDAIERQFPKIKHCMVHVNPNLQKM